MTPESFLTLSLSSADSFIRPWWHIGASRHYACKSIAGSAISLPPVRWPGPGSQPRLVHWTQAELVEQRHIAIAGGSRSRTQLWPVEDRGGHGRKAKSLRVLAHVLAAGG